MSIEGKGSLREWARENKVWESKTWESFLKDDLVPFYKYAFNLNSLHEFLKSEKICGKASLGDIEDETMRDKIRTAIYGGVGGDNDLNDSFAKFMYDTFGICANDAPSFEESIKHYESRGDGVKVCVNPDSWIDSIPIKGLVDKLDGLIRNKLCDKLDVELAEIGLQSDYPRHPINTTEPDTLLPQPDESPKELVSLMNDFRQKSMDTSIGVNPFTTFVSYTSAIPLRVFMEFLGCDMGPKLTGFMGHKAYSMIDQKEVDLPTESPDTVILLMKGYTIFDEISELQDFLIKVDPAIEETREKMIAEAIGNLHITFEQWGDYKPIFSFLHDTLKNENQFNLSVENGRIVEIMSYPHHTGNLKDQIYLRDFLIKIAPIVCTGMIQLSSMTGLKFHSLARGWIGKVIENDGKI